jgi:predicted ferric reductase
MTLMLKGALWIGLYMHIIILPLVVGALWPGEAQGRPFWIQFGAALGYAGLTIIILELALVSRIAWVSSAFGQDALLQFHRQIGIFGFTLIAVHAVIAIVSGYPVAWLNPLATDTPWAMRWGVLSGGILLLLIVISLGRRALRISYGWWQLTHGALADAAIVAAFIHAVLFEGFSAGQPMLIVLFCYAVLGFCLRAWFKIVRPLVLWSRPWEVVQNIAECGDTRTLVLRPAGHSGFTFEPGQFAWLSTERTPFHWDRHPISMSSAAADEPGQTISFTIKNLGDWSGQVVPKIAPGRRVWVDGPHGVFTADREEGPGYVLIAGGAGISPLFSMCQTLASRGDCRPVILFYAGRELENLPFRQRLDELQRQMNLKVIYVIAHPPVDWAGERGYVTGDMLKKYLPSQFRRYQYFVCGPEPMMDSVENELTRLRVPAERIHTERFVMV